MQGTVPERRDCTTQECTFLAELVRKEHWDTWCVGCEKEQRSIVVPQEQQVCGHSVTQIWAHNFPTKMNRVTEENMKSGDPDRLCVVMHVYIENRQKKNQNWRREMSDTQATITELTTENRALSQQVAKPRFSGRGKKQARDFDS